MKNCSQVAVDFAGAAAQRHLDMVPAVLIDLIGHIPGQFVVPTAFVVLIGGGEQPQLQAAELFFLLEGGNIIHIKVGLQICAVRDIQAFGQTALRSGKGEELSNRFGDFTAFPGKGIGIAVGQMYGFRAGIGGILGGKDIFQRIGIVPAGFDGSIVLHNIHLPQYNAILLDKRSISWIE